MWRGIVGGMMLRATVVDVNPKDPTRVWVTIPQKYGAKPLRVFTRVEVTKGDQVYVTNTSVTRVPQWVVFGHMSEVGSWSTPAPHEHPMGQVVGLVDWVKQYEAWAKDHQARLDAAEKQIADGKLVVDQTRKDLDKAQTDIAEAVREATLERARLDQAEANLDQMGRNLTAAGGRISANEAALTSAQNRLTSAETTVQKTSADLTALQGTVGDVSAKAEASDQKATDALTKAGAAQTSADGKNRITRATTPASQPGTAVGDTHFTMSTMGGGGTVTRQQRWDGSTWQDEALSHQVLASLDLGKATVGELDGGRIRAGTVTADRLSVGPSENSIADAGFVSLTISANRASRSDGTWNRARAAADATNYYQRVNYTGTARWHFYPLAGTTYDMTGMIPTSGDTPWRFRADVNSGGGTSQFGVYYINRDGTSAQVLIGVQSQGANVRRTISADWTTPSTVMGIQPYIQFENGDVARTSTVYGGALARPKIGTVLIEDGAITGDKVEASTVSGAIGQFLKVEAQSGTFTDSLTGRNARLLGETVAESINITGKIRGRDAILSGTVDVGQLNVTGAMSAKIISTATLQARQGFFTDGLTAQDAALLGTTVAEKLVVTDAFSARVVNAMNAQTKQLVVTEDAILNRATVVQGLVTSELITERANVNTLAANMISAGSISSVAADGSGVAMGAAGFFAFDADRKVTMYINGKTNVLTGDLQTVSNGTRARISTRAGTSAIDFLGTSQAHGGVWYDDDPKSLTIAAMPDGGYNPATSASMSFHSDSRSVRFNAAVDISHGQQHGYTQINSPGLTANQAGSYTIKFGGSLAAGAKPFAYFTPEASSGASLVCTLTSITETEMKVTLRNLSSFNSGLIYLWWTVIARTKWW